MPASPEQLLALLEAPHWKTPGSTSRKAEGRTARQPEGQAAVNLTVLDHIAEGRQVLARAARLDTEGSPLARREAAALRTSQAMKSEALMGETSAVRQHACPSCGCASLLLRKGLAFCVNRHCGPVGIQRRWNLRDLAYAGPGTPARIHRTEGNAPRDLLDKVSILAFFAPTSYPMSPATLTRIVNAYGLPSWSHPSKPRAHLYSLSDVMTAHAVHMAGREPSTCSTDTDRAACSGLGDLFFGSTESAERVDVARALCDSCPLKDACLDQALEIPASEQRGIFGGLTAKERKQLLRNRP